MLGGLACKFDHDQSEQSGQAVSSQHKLEMFVYLRLPLASYRQVSKLHVLEIYVIFKHGPSLGLR